MATPLDHESLNAGLKYVWGQYRTWALTARKYKNGVSRWRNIVLLLSISGAILGMLSQQLGALTGVLPWLSPSLGLLSGAVLGLAAYFTRAVLSPDSETRAVRARATAEALKSQAYLLATGVPPYDTVECSEELFNKVETIRKATDNVAALTITEAEKTAGILSAPMSIAGYVEQRVDDQIRFYSDQTNANTARLTRGRRVSVVLGAFAVLLGVVASQNPSIAGWIAVIGTITAAIAAQQYAGRYQFLIASYQAATEKLEGLKVRWEIERKRPPASATDQKFIQACEEAISAENSAWMAEWTKKGSSQP